MATPADDSVLDALAERTVTLGGDVGDSAGLDLSPVADALADATVVGMGEATHGTHEFFRLKADLFRRLVEDHGFRLFGLEANYSETLAVDRYVRDVDDAAARAAVAPESAANALARTYFWPWYVTELGTLIDWIRGFNEGRPREDQVRFFGFDAQYAVGPAAALQSFLADADPDLLDEHRETLAMLADWGLDADDEDLFESRVTDTRAVIDAVRERLGESRANYAEATSADAVRRAELHLATMADAVDLATTDSDVEMLKRRDRAMADGVDRLRDTTPHDRIALWAHNAHVQRVPFDFAGEATRTMGQVLTDRYGDDYAALGFTFAAGTYQAMAKDDAGEYGLRDCVVDPASAGSAGATLGTVDGSPLFLDVSEATDDTQLNELLHEERPFRQPGGMYDPEEDYESDIALADAFDALLHVDETTRAVPLGHPSEIDSW